MSDPRISPHPDAERMTSDEIRAAIAEAEEQMKLAREVPDDELEAWFICQRRALEAELARRNGIANSFPHLRENNPAESFSGLLSWAEFLSATPVEREWLIDGLIPTTGLGVIQGRGKQGKSTLVIHLCRALGLATPFLSRHTRQSPAVYINYEMPDDYLQSLIRSAEVPANSFVINRPEPILRLETIETIVEEAVSKVGSIVGC